MLQKIYFALSFISAAIFVQNEVIYSVIGPGTIRPYFKYTAAVSVHEAEGPCKFEVEISSSRYKISKIVNVEPLSTETVELDIADLDKADYVLTVKGISGLIIENTTSLSYEFNDPWVVIQTDKPIYKPGDLIQFRVLFLNEKTLPAGFRKRTEISIVDANKHRIITWRNFNLTQGVFTNKLQLSDNPAYGSWHVLVDSNGESTESKYFNITTYTLPPFQVIVDTMPDVALTEEIIKVTIEAKYTFGKPVKGTATVTIEDDKNGRKREMAINGKKHVEFDIKEFFPNSKFINEPKSYRIIASVVDDLTGHVQESMASVTLHRHHIIIHPIDEPKSYFPGKPITIRIAIRKIDGSPVHDNKNPVQLRIDGFYNKLSLDKLIDNNGIVNFNVTLESEEWINPIVSYLDKSQNLHFISPNMVQDTSEPRVHLNLKTQNPQLHKNVSIEVTWDEPLPYLVYLIVARGNIMQATHVDIARDAKSYLIEFSPTLEMIPKAAVFVQYFHNHNFRFGEETIEFERDLQNTLEISTTLDASPGDDVEFNITTDLNSFVGLLGIDQRLLLLGTGNDFTIDEIFARLVRFDTHTPPMTGEGRYPGEISGLVTLTNANYPYDNPRRLYYEGGYGGGGGLGEGGEGVGYDKSITVRKRFPETWIFDNFEMTNETSFSFIKQIPESITSWIITGFSMNSQTGIALTRSPTKIQVFKSFFISIDLPYSVKQGEVISIPVLIFNYINETLETEVTMDNSDNEFEFTEATGDVEEQTLEQAKRSKRIAMPSNSDRIISFLIKPRNVGLVTIKVTATNELAGDSVLQKLKIEPEGVMQYQNRAFFINLNKEQGEHKETVTIDIPDTAVPQSKHLVLSSIGDLVGLTLKNIDDLVRLPTRYGEQNMMNFVPNYLVLKYLETINHKMPSQSAKALENLQTGYQIELGFRRSDGSYSAYGNSDDSGSTWLTAYVARSFQQASDFIKVDQEYITKALDFLASKQTTKGNFAEFGQLFEFPQLNEVALTAFVLLAFLEDKNTSAKYDTNIQRGVQYLINNRDDTDDIYSQSISTLVLQRVQHRFANEELDKLRAVVKHERGHTWWSAKPKKQKRQTSAHTSSSDIEMTSYILLAMLENELTEEVLPIIKWLIMQRNSNGGFISTQDTVVGLQALIKFAETTGLGHAGAIDIEFVCEGSGVTDSGTLKIMPESSFDLMAHELPAATRKVEITARGNGSSLVQISYNYNTVDKESDTSLGIKAIVKENTPPNSLVISVCFLYTPSDIKNEGNKTEILIAEVTLPSGYTIVKQVLDKLRDSKPILFTETSKSDTVAIIYIQSLEAFQKQCIEVNAVRTYEVAKLKPAPVVLYYHHDKNRMATDFYEVKTSLCDICIDDCKADCASKKEIFDLSLPNTS